MQLIFWYPSVTIHLANGVSLNSGSWKLKNGAILLVLVKLIPSTALEVIYAKNYLSYTDYMITLSKVYLKLLSWWWNEAPSARLLMLL